MQRDYILRMIEQAGFVLKQLLQRIQAEPISYEERTEALSRAVSGSTTKNSSPPYRAT